MSNLVSLVIKECVVSMSPALAFQNRPGLIVHDSFSECVLPFLRPVESTAKCRYETLPLRSWLWGAKAVSKIATESAPQIRPDQC